MSYITGIDINITDLKALQAAVTELGAEWRQGQKTYAWHGRAITGDPLPEGFTIEDLGKCEHAIRLPGCEYEIGVVRKKDGSGFTCLYDHWSPIDITQPLGNGEYAPKVENGIMKGGQKLLHHFGERLGKLKQFYGVNKATLAARAKGLLVQRKTVGSTVKLVVSGF